MKILLCIEEGAEVCEAPGADQVEIWYDEKGVPLRLHVDNERALEQAVRLKEQLGKGAHLTVLCIGPEGMKEAIRRGLSFGCDRGVHIVDCETRRREPSETASIIVQFCRKTSFDLILTGAGSLEIGASVARQLGCRSAKASEILGYRDRCRMLNCRVEGEGNRPLQLPAVLTSGTGPITMARPTLPNLLSSRKKPIIVYQVNQFLEGLQYGTGAARAV